MPDKPETPTVDPAILAAQVEKVVESNARIAEALAAQNKPKADDQADELKAHTDRVKSAFSEYQKLSEDGKYGEGLQKVVEALAAQPQPRGQDPSTNPLYIATRDNTVDRVRRDDSLSPVFDKWGDEAMAAIESLPAEKQLLESEVRKAVNTVKAAHAQELIDQAVAERLASSSPVNMPAQNAPRREWGETEETEFHGLTVEQREMANTYGIDYADYATALKSLESTSSPDGRDHSASFDGQKFQGHDILPSSGKRLNIKPGEF